MIICNRRKNSACGLLYQEFRTGAIELLFVADHPVVDVLQKLFVSMHSIGDVGRHGPSNVSQIYQSVYVSL